MGVFKILGNMVANLFIGNLQGNADTATALTSSAGSTINPIYFKNGKPVACTHSLNKTVPTDAVFTDTTYSVATTSTAGLMSASDKTKLNGIASGANAYSLPTASSSTLGGVKTTSTITSTSGLTACPIISGVPYYKDTNTTYSLSSFGITATAVELNKMDGVTATAAELNYVDGVTSNIQTQLNGKAASSHTHSYAGSSSVGGAATSANKLNTNAGGATQPVYFSNGVPVKTTYTLGKSVPSDAIFTDTNTWRPLTDIYPVGAIYLSINSTSPAGLFGGTWERIKDRFLLSSGDTYAAGITDGEAAITLTIDEMPSHTHRVSYAWSWRSAPTGSETFVLFGDRDDSYSADAGFKNTGGDQPHNNMPPYLTVYAWQRTA